MAEFFRLTNSYITVHVMNLQSGPPQSDLENNNRQGRAAAGPSSFLSSSLDPVTGEETLPGVIWEAKGIIMDFINKFVIFTVIR